MLATIQKWGNSSAIRLPKSILETALIRENESVQMVVENNQIIIKKAEPAKIHKTFKQRLEKHYGKNIDIILKEIQEDTKHKFEEWETGEPVGSEVF